MAQRAEVRQSTRALHARVLCLPSINRELVCEGDASELESDLGLRVGKKHLVTEFTGITTSVDHSRFRVQVGVKKGARIGEVETGAVQSLPGGSSFNTARVLQQLGEESVAVAGPIGPGDGGRELAMAAEAMGVEHVLFTTGKGTAKTLSVRKDGKSTLFCVKPPYRTPPGVMDMLRESEAQVLFATSVKPGDMFFASQVFRALEGTTRAFTPHMELIQASHMRDKFRALTHGADVVQVNKEEGDAMLAPQYRTRTTMEKARMLAEQYEPRIFILTDEGKGAVLVQQGMEPIRQPAVPATAVDTSGAGDAHLAAFIYFWKLRDMTVEDALFMAAFVASRKVAAIGPSAGIPSEGDCRQMLASFRG